MAEKTKIEWCDFTWNMVWGCLNQCPYCYARKIAKRFYLKIYRKERSFFIGNNIAEKRAILIEDLYNFKPVFLESNFIKSLPNKPSRIFINSMSDPAFWAPGWIKRIMDKVRENPQYQFILLTKSISYRDIEEKIQEFLPDNILYGNSISTNEDLKKWTAFNHYGVNDFFLSIEPIQEPIYLERMIDCAEDFYRPELLKWVIIGAETGNRKGKVIPEIGWIEKIANYCYKHNIPMFMKNSLKAIWGPDLIQQWPGYK